MTNIKRILLTFVLLVMSVAPTFATVNIETTRVAYNCNGVLVSYAYPFKVLADGDLQVIVGTDTVLTLNADYTVTGTGSSAGTVVLTAGSKCGAGNTLTILRNMAATQGTDYIDGEAFSAESIENALDKVTMIQQQQRDEMIRTPKLPRTSTITDIALPNPSANGYIGWNSTATGLVNISAPVTSTATQYEVDALVSYGGGTSYTQATISAALTAIGTTNKVTLLLRPGNWVILTALAFPANVDVKMPTGAYFSGAAVTAGTITGLKEPTPEMFVAGNNPGVTDMTIAVKAAYSSIAATGGTVQLSATTYKFTSALTIPTSVHLVGKGKAHADTTYAPIRPTRLLKSGNFTGISVGRSASLRDLTVDGDTGNGGNGVQLIGERAAAHDIGVFSMGGDGIVVGDATNNVNGWVLSGITSGWNGGVGFKITSAVLNANVGSLTNSMAWYNTGDGFVIGYTYGNVITGCYSESNTGIGYHVLGNATFNTFVGIGGEANGGGNFIFDSGSYQNIIVGSTNIYAPVDNGGNQYIGTSGGNVGYPGLDVSGQVRAGAAGGANGLFATTAGFHARGAYPGFATLDMGASANNKNWETFVNAGVMFQRIFNDDGSGDLDYTAVTRHSTYVDTLIPNTNHYFFDQLPQYADNTAAVTAGETPGRVYMASGTGVAIKGTLLVVY